jgi:hypothetical protein
VSWGMRLPSFGCFISSHLITSYHSSSRHILSTLVSSRCVSSHLVTSHFTSLHCIPSHHFLSQFISSYLVNSRFVSLYHISSRRFSLHFIASHLIASRFPLSHVILRLVIRIRATSFTSGSPGLILSQLVAPPQPIPSGLPLVLGRPVEKVDRSFHQTLSKSTAE